MEEGKSKGRDTDFLLQWGNRKRLRCVKMKNNNINNNSSSISNNNNNVKEKSDGSLGRKKVTTTTSRGGDRRGVTVTDAYSPPSYRNIRQSPINDRMRAKGSPDKEDRYYTTRGLSLGFEDNGKMVMDSVRAGCVGGSEDKGFVWPKLLLSLSSKEKEEDFMAMKGCKLPQRPKKRAKMIQRSLLLVSPGTWLSDLCQERYEVREKKTAKKRPRGLKAMGGVESESE